jgi:hypothetical protein
MQRKRDTEENLNVAKENLKYIVYQQELYGREGGVFKGVKCANNSTWTHGVRWGGDGSMYFVEDKYWALQIVEDLLS